MPPVRKTTRRQGVSGNPAVAAQQAAQALPQPEPVNDKYAPTAWGGGTGQLAPIDLECPSGQLALVRRPGVEGLMKAGVLSNIDSLTSLVQSKHVEGAKPGVKPEIAQAAALMEDEEAMASILHTVDRVLCYCVLKPEIQMSPSDVTRRKDGVVYADMVEIVDKMFIFNYAVGGSKELEPFRRGLQELVGGLEAQSGVQGSPE